MIAKDKVKVNDYYGNTISHNMTFGAFPLFQASDHSKVNRCRYCREEVSAYRNNGAIHETCTTRIGYVRHGMNIELLDKFLTEIQDILSLKDEERVVLQIADGVNHMVVIDLPLWWQSPMRFDFLTLFIRCGGAFYKGDFLEALLAYELTKRILPQIEYFLSGHTTLANPGVRVGGANGVVTIMANTQVSSINTILSNPDEKTS